MSILEWWNMIDLITAFLALDWLRMLLAVIIGVVAVLPIKWAYKYTISPIVSLLTFHGLNWAIRWYYCPLDPPLFCRYSCEGDFYQPLRLAELLALDGDYILFWLAIFAAVVIFGGVVVWLLWKIWLAVEIKRNK